MPTIIDNGFVVDTLQNKDFPNVQQHELERIRVVDTLQIIIHELL
ncbi:hypothetical protein [Flavobacterium columnare]|nr:hypothetical protein [Flavobacterium columnare]